MRIRRENSILLVVDYQERLVPVMYNEEEIIHNSEILLAGLKILEIPMLITQQYTKGLGKTDTRLLEIIGTEDYIEKKTFSCYKELQVRNSLDIGRKTVIICGIEAHICVVQTVIDLQAAGFQCVVVQDCISSRKPLDMEIALGRMESEGATITSYESLLYELMESADAHEFKQISKLIR